MLLKPQPDLLLALLGHFPMVNLHVIPHRAVLPPALTTTDEKAETIVLQVGYDMPVSIPDLDVSEEGVTATLSFDRKAFKVRLPWASIAGMSIDETLFIGFDVGWLERLPASKPGAFDQVPSRQVPSRPKAPGLRLVTENDDER